MQNRSKSCLQLQFAVRVLNNLKLGNPKDTAWVQTTLVPALSVLDFLVKHPDAQLTEFQHYQQFICLAWLMTTLPVKNPEPEDTLSPTALAVEKHLLTLERQKCDADIFAARQETTQAKRETYEARLATVRVRNQLKGAQEQMEVLEALLVKPGAPTVELFKRLNGSLLAELAVVNQERAMHQNEHALCSAKLDVVNAQTVDPDKEPSANRAYKEVLSCRIELHNTRSLELFARQEELQDQINAAEAQLNAGA